MAFIFSIIILFNAAFERSITSYMSRDFKWFKSVAREFFPLISILLEDFYLLKSSDVSARDIFKAFDSSFKSFWDNFNWLKSSVIAANVLFKLSF